MSAIRVYGKYGDPRAQAARDDTPHGLTTSQVEHMRDRFEKFVPKVASGGSTGVRSFMDDLIPQDLQGGISWGKGAGQSYRNAQRNTHARAANLSSANFGSNGTFSTVQRPYQPEFESPDRQQYPIHRVLANRYWRLFYKMDATIGNCIELYSQLPFGNFELTGEGVDGEIRDACEYMAKETKLRSVLPAMAREFLVTGEACPHNFYDDSKGTWTYTALHNPDQLEITHAPFIKMDPVAEFRPDDRLYEVLQSNNKLLRKVRESMPEELISRLMSRQNIPLSPINFTFLPRKLHEYDTRGTSIISRMWRVLMYEDAIFNASIATARRHAGPLKVAKLGDPAMGYVPGPEIERDLIQKLAEAELDVNAWLVYNYAINFELVGTTDRVMTIDKHYDLIERIKLVALGISKAFLHGEVTYASAASGLTVFLRRLKSMREYFEDQWLYPKYFAPIAKLNKWVKPTQAELEHRVRVRRSSRELDEDNRYIVPKVEWDRSLDPSVDSEMIGAMSNLSQTFGIQFSDSTLYSMVNRNFEDEQEQLVRDYETKKRIFKEHPELMTPPGGAMGGAGGGAMGGGGVMPAVPSEAFGPDDMGDVESGEPPGGAPGTGDTGIGAAVDAAEGDTQHAPADMLDGDQRLEGWSRHDIDDLKSMFDGYEPEDDPWLRMYQSRPELKSAIVGGDPAEIWDELEEALIFEDYPTRAISALHDLLRSSGVLNDATLEHHEAKLGKLFGSSGDLDDLLIGK